MLILLTSRCKFTSLPLDVTINLYSYAIRKQRLGVTVKASD